MAMTPDAGGASASGYTRSPSGGAAVQTGAAAAAEPPAAGGQAAGSEVALKDDDGSFEKLIDKTGETGKGKTPGLENE